MLTHKGIASQLDYPNLLNTYDKIPYGRERLYERDEAFSSLLIDKIERLFSLYQEKKYGAFIRLFKSEKGFEMKKHKDKMEIKEHFENLDNLRNEKTIREVMNYIFENKLLSKPTRILEFEEEINSNKEGDEKLEKKKDFHQSLMQVRYQEVINLNKYILDYTPFSTKHGAKGTEYPNVLVVIDDDSWNRYKFNDVFSNNQCNLKRFSRTRNLLYVCCSRAKDKLAILSLTKMDNEAMKTIINWFGKENTLEIR